MRRHSGCVCKNALYACDNKNLNMFQFFAQLSRNSNISLQESLFSQHCLPTTISNFLLSIFLMLLYYSIFHHIKSNLCVKIYVPILKMKPHLYFYYKNLLMFLMPFSNTNKLISIATHFTKQKRGNIYINGALKLTFSFRDTLLPPLHSFFVTGYKYSQQ